MYYKIKFNSIHIVTTPMEIMRPFWRQFQAAGVNWQGKITIFQTFRGSIKIFHVWSLVQKMSYFILYQK